MSAGRDAGIDAGVGLRVDVAIVGCGPTGAALANLLGARGVSVLVVDRADGILQIPRAVHVDGETMRVFQAMGLAREMLRVLRPGGQMVWADAQGETLLVRKGLVGLGPQGWHNDYYFHQPQLEDVLRAGLARFPRVTVRERCELRALAADAEGVTLDLRDLAVGGGDGAALRVRCDWLVGCDGARSRVREAIGDAFEDLGEHQGWLVVDAVLDHPLDLPEHSVQHCDPARPATSIYVHPLRRRWELMLMPGDDPEEIVRPEVVWRLLSRWVKPAQAVLERAATYTFHSLVARRWQRGRVLIAGDAAHQTPPFLGQGLCAGIRDAANLAWKLAHAVRMTAAGDALVATYGPERTPHAHAFVALAVEVGRVIQVTDPAEAALRDARLKAQGLQFAFPTPRLGPGAWIARGAMDEDASRDDIVGRIAIQPELPDGRWLDDAVGPRFAVLARSGLELPAATRDRFAALDVAIVDDPGPRATAWLAEHDAAAVVLRPDRYVFDACPDGSALDASAEALARWLGAPPTDADRARAATCSMTRSTEGVTR